MIEKTKLREIYLGWNYITHKGATKIFAGIQK